MKTIVSTIVLFTLISFSASAQKKQEIKVWGNCGMCKKVIETAATGAGATKASWSEETKILSVAFNAKKTDADKIQQAIAAAGYDTQDFSAPTEVYNKLHGCCQYERKQSAQMTMHQVKMDCCKDGKCDSCQACKDGNCKNCKGCKDGKCDSCQACKDGNCKSCQECKNCSKH